MNLGFSSSTAPVQPALPQALAVQATQLAAYTLLARIAAVAAQMGALNSFFGVINTNRYFVSRMALVLPVGRDDDTFDQKKAKAIIRKLKTEKSEPSNDQRPQ
jgi:hypothetical protein